MLHILWDTRGYFFWLLVVSAFVLGLERIRPWRRDQPLLRPQFGQDLFWLVFNGHYAGILVASAAAWALAGLSPAIDPVKQVHLLAGQPLWMQFAAFFVVKDFLDWCVHNVLHRVPWLWSFHEVHHSIEVLDWAGNFRFHWMEIVAYRAVTYLPLLLLGVEARIVLWIAILTTLIGHLNHSNLNITWGPLRYVLNSPRMHVWHHDRHWPAEHASGVNFGVALSVWDWMFRTAWWPPPPSNPRQMPAEIGLPGREEFPRGLLGRLVYPLKVPWLRRR